MRVHLVHHYEPGGCACGFEKSAIAHARTVAFSRLPDAEGHAFEHGMDVDTVEIPDPFTLRDLELIVSGCDNLGRMMAADGTLAEEMRELRSKAASLAFNQVAGL
jgi:hypothetical protein